MTVHARMIYRGVLAALVTLIIVSAAVADRSEPARHDCARRDLAATTPRVMLTSHIDRYRSSQIVLSALGLVMFVYVPLAWVVSRTTR